MYSTNILPLDYISGLKVTFKKILTSLSQNNLAAAIPIFTLSTKQLWYLLIAFTFITRLPALVHSRAIDDEVIYSVVANVLVDGGKPYEAAVERKPPLLFWLYSGIYNVAGKYNYFALHLFATIWILLTMFGLFLIGRDLFDRDTGIIAAFLYALYYHWAIWRNLSFNGEVIMNLPIVLGVWLCLRQEKWRFRPWLLVAGALFCAAFLFKQPAAIAAVPMGLYLLMPAYHKKYGLAFWEGIFQAALLTIGFFVSLTIAALVLYHQGVLEEAYFWIFTHHDIPHGPTDPVFWIRGGRMTLAFVAACFPLALGSWLAFSPYRHLWQNSWGNLKAEWLTMWILFLMSVIGTAASGRFYPHYYIQMTPIMAMIAAPMLAAIFSGKIMGNRFWLKPSFLYGWIMLTVVGFLISHSYGTYNNRALLAPGVYLQENSPEDATIFVWGQKTNIYLDAERTPASRFVATFPLTGYIFGSPHSWDPSYDTSDRIVAGSWESLAREFQEKLPDYIIDEDGARAVPRYPIRNYPLLKNILDEHYQKEAKMEFGIIYKKKKS